MRGFLIFCSLLSLFACGELKPVDRSSIETEVAQRKIRKISDGDVLIIAETKGSELSSVWLTLDSLKKIQFADSLSKVGIQFRVLQIQDSGSASAQEKSLLEAYVYNLSRGKGTENNIQLINKSSVLFTSVDYSQDFRMLSILFTRKVLIQQMD